MLLKRIPMKEAGWDAILGMREGLADQNDLSTRDEVVSSDSPLPKRDTWFPGQIAEIRSTVITLK